MKNQTIVYDLETTGLHIKQDKIIEIYLYNVEQETCRHILINPKMNIPSDSIKVHGLTNFDLEREPIFKDVVEDIYDFVGEEPYMISHNNIAFDKPFLLSEIKRANLPNPMGWKFIDTLHIARKLYDNLENYKQDTLREKFKITNKGSHRANKDVKDLAIILNHMRKDSNKTIEELYELSNNYYYKTMPFGKYKHMKIKEVPNDYIQWMIKKKFFKKNEILKKSFIKAGKLKVKKNSKKKKQ